VEGDKTVIQPYNAVGLVPTVWGVGARSEIMRLFMLHAAAAVAIGVLLAIPVSIIAVEAIILRTLNSYFVVDATFNFVPRDLLLLALLETVLIMISTWLAVHNVLAPVAAK
jgi:hypothetical protein